MYRIEKAIILFLVFTLSLNLAHAQFYDFDVSSKPIRSEIFLNEPALFEITIKNSGNKEDTYRISVEDFTSWSAQTDPISHRLSGITLKGGESQKTTLLLHPREIKAGRTAVQAVVRSEATNKKITLLLKVNVREKFKIPDIEPNVGITLKLAEEGKFDPRVENLIQVEIKNKNQLTIDELTVNLKSSLIEESRSGISLQPLERKKEVFIINFDPIEKPRTDSIVATVNIDNKTFVEISDYEIIPFTTAFKEDYQTDKSFLKTTTLIEVFNPSNSRKKDQVNFETGVLKGIFTSTEPKAGVVQEDGNKFLEWTLELESGETRTLTAVTNYRTLFYLIVLVIVLIAVYYVFRSQLVLHKKVMRIGRKEGGISEIKVVMHVRNRGNAPIEDVKIVDKIPHIADIVKEFEVGTMHPSKVIRKHRGTTLLRWDIESLESREERVINYTIKSKLSILGQFILPVAAAKYKNSKGQVRKTRSNVLRLNA